MAKTVQDILDAASGGERFTTPGACAGSFYAIKAINGDAVVKLNGSSNFRNITASNITIREGDTLFVYTADLTLVSGEVLAYDAD